MHSKRRCILNNFHAGYYRVVYDRALINLIIKQLEEDHRVFNFATRSQLFDDHFRSAHARYIGINHALQLTSYLQKEDDIIVWTTVFNNFRKIYQRISDTPLREYFKVFILRLIKPPFQRLGTHLPDTATPSDIMLHAMFMEWLCTLEDDLCDQIVVGYMTKWFENPKSSP